MLKRVIDAEMPKDTEEQVVRTLKETEALFPFMLNLTPKERKALPKMGKKSLDFVERAIMYANENRNMVPPFMDVEAQDRDLTLLKQVRRILGVLAPFCDKLKDTYHVLGSEAYSSARTFYNTVKRASKAGVLGSGTISKDLAERYKRQFTTDGEGAPEVPVTAPQASQEKKQSKTN
jgi:hypothetical protein